MDLKEVQIVFGRPDFWPKVVAQHELFLRKAPKLEEAVASIVDPARPAVDHDQHLIVVLLQLVRVTPNLRPEAARVGPPVLLGFKGDGQSASAASIAASSWSPMAVTSASIG